MANGRKVLGIVLAGGQGTRLLPLTADRAKPAVPFGGIYRLIDFVLSNLVNGGFLKIVVLTQYKNHSLDRHITTTWRMSTLLGNYVTPVPAQQRVGPRWFAGLGRRDLPEPQPGARRAARLHLGVRRRPHLPHGSAPDARPAHRRRARVRRSPGIRAPRKEASAFGVIQTAQTGPDAGRRIEAFLEKPQDIEGIGLPDSPDEVFASMGNYCFTTDALLDAVNRDAADERSLHDMGGNIIPSFVDRGEAQVYDFNDNIVPGATERDSGYWRDVGSLDAYYDAHMDLDLGAPDFQSLQRELADLHPAPAAAAGQDRARPHPSGRLDAVERRDRRRLDGDAIGALAERAHREPGQHRRQCAARERASGSRRGDPQRDHRQERGDPGRRQDRCRRCSRPRTLHRV